MKLMGRGKDKAKDEKRKVIGKKPLHETIVSKISAGATAVALAAVLCGGCGGLNPRVKSPENMFKDKYGKVIFDKDSVESEIPELHLKKGRCNIGDFETGDLIFQSLPNNALVDTIEDLTASELSHVGMVVITEKGTYVIEALDGVSVTPIDEWISRGEELSQGVDFLLYRLSRKYPSRNKVISGAVDYAISQLGKEYDLAYELGEDKHYCSELIWYAFDKSVAGPVKLKNMPGSYKIELHEDIIRLLGEGEIPYDREIVMPVSLSKSEDFKGVYPCNDKLFFL